MQTSRVVHMQVSKLQSQADEAATALSQTRAAAQQAVTERSQAEAKGRADMKVWQTHTTGSVALGPVHLTCKQKQPPCPTVLLGHNAAGSYASNRQPAVHMQGLCHLPQLL